MHGFGTGLIILTGLKSSGGLTIGAGLLVGDNRRKNI